MTQIPQRWHPVASFARSQRIKFEQNQLEMPNCDKMTTSGVFIALKSD